MKVAAIIQARMGSSRLPGKVLRPIADRPMLAHVIARVQSAHSSNAVCVATSSAAIDDPVVELARECGAETFRGSESDVLARYAGAARALSADLIVRITADCPLFSGALLDEMVRARVARVAQDGEIDHFSNVIERTYPRGLDTEIVRCDALLAVDRECSDPRAREHVTWGIYSQPSRFRLAAYRDPTGADHSAMRWTVDTQADLDFVSSVYEQLYAADPLFGLPEVYALLRARPELSAINAAVEQVHV